MVALTIGSELEEEPSVQTYKGYVVDTQMKSANIYIDQENNVALAQARYTRHSYW